MNHNINPLVVINGIIARADVAKIIAMLIGVDFNYNIRMANIHEITQYLNIQNGH